MVSLRAERGCLLPLFLVRHSQSDILQRRHIPAGECSLGSVSNSWGMNVKIRVKCNALASCLQNDKHSPPDHIAIRREVSGVCGK